MTVSIIIPVFNEERTLKLILEKVKSVKLRQGLKKEILVVDDASKDKTPQILADVKGIRVFKHKNNQGKGAAVGTGIKKASGEIILIQDADLEYNPEDYPRLLEPILKGNTKVVYGSRLKEYPLKIAGKKKTPLIAHYFGNKFLTLITNILYGNGLTDMETCYKVFTKDIIRTIDINAQRFDFEPEITAKILKNGYKIHEVPIKVKPRGYDEGKKITWKDGFIAVWTLIKYKFVE